MSLYPSFQGPIGSIYNPDGTRKLSTPDPSQQMGAAGIPGFSDAPGIFDDAMPAQTVDPASVGADDITVPKRPGFLGRIRSQPGGDRALLEFGAAMLSAPSFGEGLGKGALAYRNALDTEADKLKPQMTKDFTHTYSIDPETGKPTFERTPVADYEIENAIRKQKAAEAIARMNGTFRSDISDNTLRYRDKWESREGDYKDARLEAEKGWRKEENTARIEAARVQAQARIDQITATQNGKPPPAAIQKQITDGYDSIMSYDATLAKADTVLGYLENGELELSLAANLSNKVRDTTGIGANDQSVKWGEMNTFIEGLRNTVLMDAKGVQTDGDADRARRELLAGTGDVHSVMANLRKVRENMQRRRVYTQGRVDDIANQSGAEVTNTRAAANAPRSSTKPKPTVSNW